MGHISGNRPRGSRWHDVLRAGVARVQGAAWPRSQRALLVTSAVCLCVLAAGVSVAVFSSPPGGQVSRIASTGSTAPAAAPTQPQASQPSHATAGAKVTSDGINKTALRWPPRLRHKMVRWAHGPGGAALTSLTTELGQAMQAGGMKLYPQMRQVCVSLAGSVAAARAAPPIPDAAMQRVYARTLVGIARAAATCRRAISSHPSGDEDTETHVNQALLKRSRLRFAAMSARLYRATAEIRPLIH
jgi:hypothetical protein